MTFQIKWDGLDQLTEELRTMASGKALEKASVALGSQWQKEARAMERAKYTHGYWTGNQQRNTLVYWENGKKTIVLDPKTEYSVYTEYGTRKMDAMPVLKPTLDMTKKRAPSVIEYYLKKDIK